MISYIFVVAVQTQQVKVTERPGLSRILATTVVPTSLVLVTVLPVISASEKYCINVLIRSLESPRDVKRGGGGAWFTIHSVPI